MALEMIRINTAGMTPEQLYDAMDQKLANLVQQLNRKLLLFDDQDTSIIETRKTILTIEQTQSEFEQVITNNIAAIDGNIYKIHGDLADYKKVVAGELTAVDGYIETLRGDFTKFKLGEFEELKTKALTADTADLRYVNIGKFDAIDGYVKNLEGDFIKFKSGEFEALRTKALTADTADLRYVNMGKFDALEGHVGTLEGDFIKFKSGEFGDVSALVGKIQTLIFGSATGDSITTEFSNSVVSHIGTAQIHSGMIKDLAFDKITGFDVNTTNLMIHSEDGKSQWKDNTIQISDANRVRVQIGKDASDDYSMYVWDVNGKLMFDALGLTGNGIQREIIRNDMVSQDAAIDAGKLDLVSLFREVNGNIEKLETGKLKFDGKSLELFLGAITSDLESQGAQLSSQGTQITAVQGQINSKIWQEDINSVTGEMRTQYSILEQNLNGFKTTVSDTYSTKQETLNVAGIAKNAVDEVQKTNSKISEITTDLSHITSRVTDTETSVTRINGDVTNLTNRVKEAELQITKDAIVSKVSDVYATTNALAAVDGKFAKYSTTSQMNSAIEQKANSITSTVSNTYATKTETSAIKGAADAAKSAIDNLQIGGRNLALASGEGWNTGSYNVLQGKLSESWVVGETYTISIKGTVNGGGFGLWRDSGSAVVKATLPYNADKGLYIYTFQCPAKNVNDTTEDSFSIYNYPSSSAVSASIEWIKIEKGNKATDWTPALEDVDESIGMAQDDAADAKAAVEIAETTIQQLSDSISQLVIGKNGQSLMKQTEDGWVFDMKDILGDLDTAADNIGELNDNIGNIQDNVGMLKETVTPLSDVGSYVTIGKEPKQPYIELGKKGSEGSEFKVRITNTGIQFMEGNDTPAYINNQKLNIKKAIVEDELQFGGFVWTERANGNMGLLWKGEN